MIDKNEIVLTCYHCGNRSPHELLVTHIGNMLFEQIGLSDSYYEPFIFEVYECKTCNCLEVIGNFKDYPQASYLVPKTLSLEISNRQRLYPSGPGLIPPIHTVEPSNPIPEELLRIYESAWNLQFKNPPAFVGQIRKALEFICQNKNAKGSSLYEKLIDLANQNILPSNITEATDLIRKIGNEGVHFSDKEVELWDAELIDSLLRSIIEYVYIIPAKIARLKTRRSA